MIILKVLDILGTICMKILYIERPSKYEWKRILNPDFEEEMVVSLYK